MSTTEIMVVIGGLIFGYWVVSLLTTKKPPADKTAPVPSDGSDSVGLDESSTQLSWSQVLQVPESAGPEEIRAAYQNLISQYHPDKVTALGIELRALADKKSKVINAAYEEGLRSRAQQP
jgi:DnaJ-domain-containing protein 1